jgi:cytochrome c biogenesis protein CcmG/thiol:disulfide interchange protein DsbE
VSAWRRRILIALAAGAGLALVGSSIVIATIAGTPGGREVPQAPYGESASASAPPAPSAAWVRRSLRGSPPPLAELHRDGSRLLGSGLEARLRALRGYPVVLNAWASWCAACRQELPAMARAAGRFGRRVAFLGADVDDSASDAHRMLAGDHLSYPSYRASASQVRSLSPIVGFPTTIYLDRGGRVVFTHQGEYASAGQLASDVRRFSLQRSGPG